MTEKFLLKVIKIFVFLIVIGTPLFYFRYGVYPYTLAKILFFQAAVEILFFLWLALAISSPRYRPKPTPLVIAGGAFLGIYFLTSLTGIDFWRSFWSTYERGIGFFAMFHLAAFGLVLSSLYKELPWRKIFYGSLAVSVVVGLLAYIQIYIPGLLLVENPGERPGATFGNPTFMTGYLVLNVFLSVYLFFILMKEAKLYGRMPYVKLFFVAAAGAFNVSVIFFAQTRGDILGMGAGFLALLAFFAFRPPEGAHGFLASRKTYAVSLATVVFLAATFFFTINNPFWGKIPGLARFQSISFSEDSPLFPRLLALDIGWKGFLEKPVLGWGPGNFAPLFDRYYDPRVLKLSYKETHADKPHNFLVEYADSGGIILFLALLSLFGAAAYEAMKQKDKLWRAVFIAALVSYVVGQSFFFETIGPLLMFYLFFGATNGSFREKPAEVAGGNDSAGQFSGGSRISGAVLGSCLALAAVPVYAVNIQSLMASYHQYEGFQKFLSQDIFFGLRSFENAGNIWSPYSWNFKRDYAIAVAGQYFNYPGTVSDEDVLKAVQAMEKVRDQHPEDAFNHYALVNLYNEVAKINPKEFTQKAEDEARIALEISPNRQETYFYLAKTKTIEGDYAGALSILKRVLDYSPGVPDAHFYYGIMAYATGDKTAGYNEIKAAIAMGREWSTFYEPRVVAGFFADSGYLDEATELYKLAWEMSGRTDVETEIKLGVAYFYGGKYDDAKLHLENAIKKFDIVKSPSYDQLEPIFRQLGINPAGH